MKICPMDKMDKMDKIGSKYLQIQNERLEKV